MSVRSRFSVVHRHPGQRCRRLLLSWGMANRRGLRAVLSIRLPTVPTRDGDLGQVPEGMRMMDDCRSLPVELPNRALQPGRRTDQMKIWQRLGACALAFLWACAATPRYAPGKHYFLWANLHVDPPVPSDEISGDQARQLASEGKPFYEVDYDASGRIVNFDPHQELRGAPTSRPDSSSRPCPSNRRCRRTGASVAALPLVPAAERQYR
jgi:hypothetical protein